MDWKALLTSKTVWGLLIGIIAPLLAKHGYSIDADGTVNDIIGVAGAILALYGRVTAQAPLVGPNTKANQDATTIPNQKGFIRLPVLLAISLLAACATLGLSQHQTVDQSLLEAESTATAALSMSTSLLESKSITLAQDVAVRKSHDVVIAAVRTGHNAIGAGDPAKAAAELSAIQADVDLLQSFISAHK